MARERSPSDGRRRAIRLTERGREAFETLDSRSATEIRDLLRPLTDEEQRRLVEAMETVRGILEDARERRRFSLRPLRPGDLGWVVQRHGALYAEEYGLDDTFEALVARIVADYVESRDSRRERAWIAEVDEVPVGCVFCVAKEEHVAQLRLLLVEPDARGLGAGARLVEECVSFARAAGYGQLVLWTNDVLVAARRLYERAGFELVGEEEHHSFGRDLVGQNWLLEL